MRPLIRLKNFHDQLGREVTIPFPPARIISLVPSQTELLFYLGLQNEVVGITKFCVHPKNLCRLKPKVGGTKKIYKEVIAALEPDLIIANKEENDKLQIEELAQNFPVWISDIKTLQDAYKMISSIGKITDKTTAAENLNLEIANAFHTRENRMPQHSAAYLIWRKPFMAAGNDTFISHLMQQAGFYNVVDNRSRYPEVTLEELNKYQPHYILLSSEPYPFSEKHAQEIKKEIPGAKILLVDGEMFSWYGSRLLLAPEYFSKLRKNS